MCLTLKNQPIPKVGPTLQMTALEHILPILSVPLFEKNLWFEKMIIFRII